MDNYEKQAFDFLNETRTEFKALFFKHDYHFVDDHDKRDIYQITLKRGSRGFNFNFGQSLKASQKIGVNGFLIAGQVPTAYDVLACLTKCDPGSFEEFCEDYGYDTDSRKAEKVYNAVKNEWLNIQKLWNDAEIEKLADIQ